MAITRTQIARQLLNGGGASSNRGDRQGVGRGDKGRDDFGQFERRQRQNQALQGAGFLGKDEGMNVGPQKNILQRGFETFKPLPLRLIDALGNIGLDTPVDTTMFNRGGDEQGVDPMLLYRRMMAQQARTTDNVPTEDEEEKKLSPKSFRFFNKGGIADTVVGGEFDFESARQMYGLGKLVKKATRTIKKIAKSPIGKAALLYGAGSLGLKGLGQFRAGTGIFSPTGFLKSKALPFLVGKAPQFMGPVSKGYMTPGSSGILGTAGKFSPFKTILGASVLAGLTAKEEEDDTTLQTANLGPGLTIPENQYRFFQEGGSTEKEPVAKKTMPLLDMGGMEKDYIDFLV